MSITWEISDFDVDAEGFYGQKVKLQTVLALISAKTDQDAYNAYRKLDGVVCMNDVTYESALQVTKIILAILPSCSEFSRKWCLELLVDISSGTGLVTTQPDYKKMCINEMKLSFWYFVNGLQFGRLEDLTLYVDLLGAIGECHKDLRNTVIFYLEKALTRSMDNSEMIKNTLEDLRQVN